MITPVRWRIGDLVRELTMCSGKGRVDVCRRSEGSEATLVHHHVPRSEEAPECDDFRRVVKSVEGGDYYIRSEGHTHVIHDAVVASQAVRNRR